MARKTFFDPEHRARIVTRIQTLRPDSRRRWGRMSAPQMVAHLRDQMRHTLGEVPCASVRGPLRLPLVRYLSIYWVPWPRGVLKGPPDAFVTRPGEWAADVADLVALVGRLGQRDPGGQWSDHALFGAMTGVDWGIFCHKHFDHHLRQFGA